MKKRSKKRCSWQMKFVGIRCLRRFLFIFLLLFGMTQVYGQQKKINISLKNVSLENVFQELRKQSNYRFVYGSEDIRSIVLPVVELKDASIDEAMLFCLKGTDLVYLLENNVVIVKKRNSKGVQQRATRIVGKVTDEQKQPLPGVSVLVKGTVTGTSTNKDGKYFLELPRVENISLLFSFIGMKSKEVKYVGVDTINVVMEEDISEVEEVVVTGYQTINKTRMTGAVEVVTAKDIANKGYVSVGDVLRGSLAGVSTRNTSGKPGALPEIRIRGLNSLYGDMNPTWIVDGMPFTGNLNDLVPEDIESITVLKDAAATAIYGSQAANGVIVVKRKRGREGRPSISVSSNFSIESAPQSKLDLMNSEEKIAFERSVYEDFPNQTVGGRVFMLLKNADMGKITHEEAEAEITRLSKINTDWYDVIFRKPFSHSHNIAFSGGTDKTKYYASLSIQQRKGLVPSNDYSNWNAMLRLSYDFNKRLSFSLGLSSNIRKDKDSDAGVSILHYATFANPYERPYDEEGNMEYDRSYSYQLSSLKDGYRSDFNILNEIHSNTSCINALSNAIYLDIELRILDNLKFITSGAINHSFSNTETVYKPGTYGSKNNAWIRVLFNELPDNLNNGSLRHQNVRNKSYTWSNRLEYVQNFQKGHFLNAFFGYEMSEASGNSNSVSFPEYDPDKGLVNVPEIGADKIAYVQQMIKNLIDQTEARNRSVSFFVSMGYSYKDRYVFSASARMDGADVIGSKNRFSPLWNASLKYNLHKEHFMERFGWLNELAFRFSYGYTGSIDKTALPFNILSYEMSSRFFDVDIPSYIAPKNPSIKWQKKQDRSVGLDMAFLGRRIRATVNYYNNVTRDLLDSKTLPVSVGISTIRYNSSSIRNYGVEVSLHSENIRKRDFTWTTFLNIANNKNKIIESYYKNVQDVPKGYERTEPVEGTSTNSWIGYRFAGIDPLTGHTLALVDNSNRENPIGFQREDGTWVLDMDDSLNEKDKRRIKTTLGDSYPPISGGFGTAFSWKQWSLSTRFTFMAGHKITSAYYSVANGGSFSSASQNVLRQEFNRWRKAGDITDMPGYNTSGMTSSLQSDWYDRKLERGDFLKCTEISLGYYLPSNICKKLLITSCRANLNIRDIFTISKYKGLDPENFGGFSYPNSKKYTLSLSIGF